MFLDLNLVAFKVDDLVGAKQWYTRLLGSGPVMEEPDSIVFDIGRGRLGLRLADSSRDGADPGTVAYWSVSDIGAEYGRLLELGASEFGGIQDMGRGFSWGQGAGSIWKYPGNNSGKRNSGQQGHR